MKELWPVTYCGNPGMRRVQLTKAHAMAMVAKWAVILFFNYTSITNPSQTRLVILSLALALGLHVQLALLPAWMTQVWLAVLTQPKCG